MTIQASPDAMDFAGLAALRSKTDRNDPQVLREVARQFESLFTNMMLKNMRAASMGDPLMGGDEQDTYFEMFDQQISVEMSRGRGLGLADMLVRQLSGTVTNSGEHKLAPQVATARAVQATPVTRPEAGNGGKLQAEDFARALWPHARDAAQDLGVDPRVIVAQAALETGWGRSMPGAPGGASSNNLFGIKADSRWAGPKVSAETMEFTAGALRKQKSSFRAYSTIANSVRDYVSFLKDNPRYSKALAAGKDAGKFAHELQAAGYATDPHYADKILSIIGSGKLDELYGGLKFSAGLPISNVEAGMSMSKRGVSGSTGT